MVVSDLSAVKQLSPIIISSHHTYVFLPPATTTGLHSSIVQKERLEALEILQKVLSHDNEDLHNIALESMEVDKVLCLKLGYAVANYPAAHVTSSSKKPQDLEASKEVHLICQCLVRVYNNCSQNHQLQSFQNIGVTELIPLLLQTCTRVFRHHQSIKNIHETAKIFNTVGATIVELLRTLRVFAKLVPAKPMLIQGMRRELYGLLMAEIVSYMKQQPLTIKEETFETLGLIKDLTFRSQADHKAIMLKMGKGALSNILTWSCDKIEELHPKIQEWVTAILWNMMLENVTRDLFMAQIGDELFYGKVITGLFRILGHVSVKSENKGFHKKTRRNAVSAVGNILSDSKRSQEILSSTDTPLPLLTTLMEVVKTDDDSIVRRRAMRTIRCLMQASRDEVQHPVGSQSIPTAFLVDLISQKIVDEDENDVDTHIQACQIVLAMERKFLDEEWGDLQAALLARIESTMHPRLAEAASRCLAESVKHVEWNWKSSLQPEILCERLSILVGSHPSSHNAISYLCHEIAKAEDEKRKQNPGKSLVSSILATAPGANTLSTILSNTDPANNLSRDRALGTVNILLQNDTNKKPLAANEGLLSSLVNICLLQPSAKIKCAAKSAILVLVPEM